MAITRSVTPDPSDGHDRTIEDTTAKARPLSLLSSMTSCTLTSLGR